MENLRTVRGVHDLLPDELHKHHKVIKSGVAIGPILSLIVFFNSRTNSSEESTPTLRDT